jgi:23S rRNA pseudouridine2605 synthase
MPSEAVRLQKFIASTGLASRRDAEKMIGEGKIYVNGRKAELGSKIDPSSDRVSYKGKLLEPEEKLTMIFHKPKGFLCNHDGRRDGGTIFETFPDLRGYRVVVGLEKAASGLILLSNDGDLLQGVARQFRHLPRSFHLRFKEELSEGTVARLKKGIHCDDRRLVVDSVKEIPKEKGAIWYEFRLRDQRDQLLEKVMKNLGHPAQRIVQVGFAHIRDDQLKKGKGRLLTQKEIAGLKDFSGI